MSRLVVISNRVAELESGKTAPGGLAVGVLDALKQSGGLWFGWNGKISEQPGTIESHEHQGITLATTALTQREYDHYYKGFSNATLWPSFHYRIDLARFERADYDGYRQVNARLARALKPLLRSDDILWVHDYHLIPFAQELRALGVRNRIGFFLHIPFPAPEVIKTIPPHTELMRALSAFDLVGFQTAEHQQAFLDYMTRELDLETDDSEHGALFCNGRRLRSGVYPIGVDPNDIQLTAQRYLSRSRGLSRISPWKIVLSADRLDYTKGLLQRFEAFETLLERFPEHHGQVRFTQIAPSSRADLHSYRDIREQLETLTGHINGRFSELDWVPVNYICRSYERRTLMALYRRAQVGLVTPLRDGMNLVAKEFVAAQDPEDPGVLVLSRFAGAAGELDAALLVNPHDTEATAMALDQALRMPLQERRRRHASMMQALQRNSIRHWRQNFLADLRRPEDSRVSPALAAAV